MSNFDISRLMSKAQEVTTQGSGQGLGKYPYRTIFIKPNDARASLTVRLLPNVKTNLLAIKYYTHKIGDSRYNCGYNLVTQNAHVPDEDKCPVCKTIQNIKSLRGYDHLSEYATTRVMLLAQYISSESYTWSERYPQPNQGDIVIVMGPAGMYTAVYNMLTSQGPDGASGLLSDHKGDAVVFSRDSNNRVIVNPKMRFTFESAPTQEEYNDLLNGLPNLHDIPLSGVDTDNYMNVLVGLSQSLERSYLNPATPNQNIESQVAQAQQHAQPQPTQQVAHQQAPVHNLWSQQPTQVQPAQQHPWGAPQQSTTPAQDPAHWSQSMESQVAQATSQVNPDTQWQTDPVVPEIQQPAQQVQQPQQTNQQQQQQPQYQQPQWGNVGNENK